jgi:hypothetical protein
MIFIPYPLFVANDGIACTGIAGATPGQQLGVDSIPADVRVSSINRGFCCNRFQTTLASRIDFAPQQFRIKIDAA